MRVRERDWLILTIGGTLLFGCLVGRGVSAEIERRRAFATMDAVRAIATALEKYAEEKHSYPRAGDVETLSRVLIPRFLPAMAKSDGWGNPFLIRSGNEEYRIVSTGADGRVEKVVAEWFGGPSDSLVSDTARAQMEWDYRFGNRSYPKNAELGARDIAFANGNFVRAPEMSSNHSDVRYPPSLAVRIVTKRIAITAVLIIVGQILLMFRRWDRHVLLSSLPGDHPKEKL